MTGAEHVAAAERSVDRTGPVSRPEQITAIGQAHALIAIAEAANRIAGALETFLVLVREDIAREAGQ